DLVGYFKAATGGYAAFLQRPRDDHRLERRTGFVVEADGAILQRFDRLGPWIVGVYLGPVGHRKDRAGAGIHDDRRGVLWLEHLADRAQDVFRSLLDVGIQR